MSHGEQTRGKSVSPRGVWLFENLKKPPEAVVFHQMNRYPFSKASCSAAGEKRDGGVRKAGLLVEVEVEVRGCFQAEGRHY